MRLRRAAEIAGKKNTEQPKFLFLVCGQTVVQIEKTASAAGSLGNVDAHIAYPPTRPEL